MNVVTLAARMVGRRRRVMLRSAIPLGFASFAFVISAAILTTVNDAIGEVERTELSGELQLRQKAEPQALAGLVAKISSPAVLVSHAWITPAIVTVSSGSFIAEIWFTDVDRELAFRGHANVRDEEEQADESSILSMGIVSAGRMEVLNVTEAAVHGSGFTLTIPGSASISLASVRLVNLAQMGTVIMLPWDLLPQRRGEEPALGSELVRMRGVVPLNSGEVDHWVTETGLEPTGWRRIARSRIQELWWLFVALIGLLHVTGGVAAAPSVGILIRRYSADFELLTAIGYSIGYVRGIVVAIGTITAALAAGIGAFAGSVVISIAIVRGGFEPSFLPLYWLESNPVLGLLVPRPPIAWAVIAVGVATAIGAAAALPSTRLVATFKPGGGVGR